MAGVINRIRTKGSMALLILIGIAMASFVLTDVLQRVQQIFTGSAPDAVGVVDGEEINSKYFNARVEEAKTLAQLNQDPNNPQPVDVTRVSNDTWTQVINEIIYDKQYKPLGLKVTPDEFTDMLFGPEPDPTATQMFGDRNSMQQVMQQAEKDPQLKFRIQMAEKYLMENRLRRKYEALVKGGIFVSKAEARRRYQEENTRYSFEYLAINYAAIADSTVKVEESDYTRFYQENIEEFRQPFAQSIISYVSFPKTATRRDSMTAYNYLAGLVQEFRTTDSDSIFAVTKNRSGQAFRYEFMQRAELDAETSERIKDAAVDSVIGPILTNGMYKLVKLTDVARRDTAPFLKLRHIFLKPKGNSAQDTFQVQMQAQIQASMINADNFAQYVQSLSDDQSTKQQGGDLGWYRYGSFGKKFDDQVKKLQKGQIASIMSDYGAHIVEVQDRSVEGVRVATIAHDIVPGQQTLDSLMMIAENFRQAAKDTASFNRKAAEMKYAVNPNQTVQPGAAFIGGLYGSGVKDIIVWALTTDADEQVSKPFETENAFVVPIITEKQERGHRSLASVKEQIRPRVLAAKKAEMILSRYNSAVKNKSDLQQMRNEYGPGAYTNVANDVTFSSGYIPGIGQDPLLIGALPGLKSGQVSKPIVGKTGVFVLRVSEIRQADKLDDKALEDYRYTQQQTKRNAYVNKVQQGLRSHAEIVDMRYNFGL